MDKPPVVGGDWSTWLEAPTTSTPTPPVACICSGAQCHGGNEHMFRLPYTKAPCYGTCPEWDDFSVVRCPRCSEWIKPIGFHYHYDRRHRARRNSRRVGEWVSELPTGVNDRCTITLTPLKINGDIDDDFANALISPTSVPPLPPLAVKRRAFVAEPDESSNDTLYFDKQQASRMVARKTLPSQPKLVATHKKANTLLSKRHDKDAPSKPVNSTKSNMSSTLIVREEAPLTLKITKLDKQSNKKGNNAGVKVVTKTKSVKIEPVHTLLNVKKIEPIDVFSIDADDEILHSVTPSTSASHEAQKPLPKPVVHALRREAANDAIFNQPVDGTFIKLGHDNNSISQRQRARNAARNMKVELSVPPPPSLPVITEMATEVIRPKAAHLPPAPAVKRFFDPSTHAHVPPRPQALTNYGMRLTVISDLRAKHEHALVQQRRIAITNLLKENILSPSDDSSTDDECSDANGSRQDYDDAELRYASTNNDYSLLLSDRKYDCYIDAVSTLVSHNSFAVGPSRTTQQRLATITSAQRSRPSVQLRPMQAVQTRYAPPPLKRVHRPTAAVGNMQQQPPALTPMVPRATAANHQSNSAPRLRELLQSPSATGNVQRHQIAQQMPVLSPTIVDITIDNAVASMQQQTMSTTAQHHQQQQQQQQERQQRAHMQQDRHGQQLAPQQRLQMALNNAAMVQQQQQPMIVNEHMQHPSQTPTPPMISAPQHTHLAHHAYTQAHTGVSGWPQQQPVQQQQQQTTMKRVEPPLITLYDNADHRLQMQPQQQDNSIASSSQHYAQQQQANNQGSRRKRARLMSQANNDQPPSSHTYVLSGGGNMHNNVPGGTYVTIVPANQQLHSPPQIVQVTDNLLVSPPPQQQQTPVMQYYQPVSNMQPMRVYAQQQPIQQQQQTMVQPKRGTALLTGPPQTVGNVQPMNGITQQHYNQIQQQQSHSGVSMTHLMTNKSILARNMTGIRPPPPSYSSSVHQAPVKTVFRPAVSLNAAPQFMNTTRGVQQVQIVHHHPGQQPQVYAQNMQRQPCQQSAPMIQPQQHFVIAQYPQQQVLLNQQAFNVQPQQHMQQHVQQTVQQRNYHAVTPVRMPPPPRPPQR